MGDTEKGAMCAQKVLKFLESLAGKRNVVGHEDSEPVQLFTFLTHQCQALVRETICVATYFVHGFRPLLKAACKQLDRAD